MRRSFLFLFLALIVAGGAFALTVGPFTSDGLLDALRDPRFHNEAGYTLGQAGDWAKARVEFERALAIDPGYMSARNNLAIANFQLADYDHAIEEYRTLLTNDPGNRVYKFDLAQSLVAHARFSETDGTEAVAQLSKALELLGSVGDYPHARENAQIIREVLADVTVATS